jgi:Glycolipid 2-alpha-mannosyltransferase
MLTPDHRYSPRCYCHARLWSLWLGLRPALFRRRFWSMLLLILVVLLSIFWASTCTTSSTARAEDASRRGVVRPAGSAFLASREDPVKWLLAYSNNHYAYNSERSWRDLFKYGQWSPRPRAALISLVRNEELDGIMQSMRQLEYHWNHKYRYPWIFFNEQPFTDEFRVSLGTHLQPQRADLTGYNFKPYGRALLLRNRPTRALEHTELDRRGTLHGQSRLARHDWGG